MPTHVHKRSLGYSGGGDYMQVGSYTAGALRQNGTWAATPGVRGSGPVADGGDVIDVGVGFGYGYDGVRQPTAGVMFYASEDMWDPVKRRRVLWGWIPAHPAGTQSLPRTVTWHPELQQLVFSPLRELRQLRSAAPLFAPGPQPMALPARHWRPLELRSNGGAGGTRVEIELLFRRPSAPALATEPAHPDTTHTEVGWDID